MVPRRSGLKDKFRIVYGVILKLNKIFQFRFTKYEQNRGVIPDIQHHEIHFAIQTHPRFNAVAVVTVEAVVPAVACVQAVAFLL